MAKSKGDALSALIDKLRALQAPDTSTVPHIVVIALAGTAKTSTLVDGLRVMGNHVFFTKSRAFEYEPSQQQIDIWDAMMMGRDETKTVCFSAFNDSIVKVLRQRVHSAYNVMTMHSIGYRAVTKAFGTAERLQLDKNRVATLTAEVAGEDLTGLRRRDPLLIPAVVQLVRMVKMNLLPMDVEDDQDRREVDRLLTDLVDYYDVEINYLNRDLIFDLVPKVVTRCKDVKADNTIDYDDMIWLPVILGLPVFKYDMLLVDEAQDLSRCQQQLALRAGKRLVLCGDHRQAIYGFAGADCDSLPRLQEELQRTKRGCVVMPLTINRRCAKAVIREVQKTVPELEAWDEAPEGRVYIPNPDSYEYIVWHNALESGDLVVCRCNGPLVRLRYDLSRQGRHCIILGHNIGANLIRLVERLGGHTMEQFYDRLLEWRDEALAKEQGKERPNVQQIINIQDKYNSITNFAVDCNSYLDIVSRIRAAFGDDSRDVIRLATIHKAKGLEARRVFFLRPKGAECPHPNARTEWQKEQEKNLMYIAQTRAQEELIYVDTI